MGLFGKDGRGFVSDDGRVFLERCPVCVRENWGPAVASGRCAWCGHDPIVHRALTEEPTRLATPQTGAEPVAAATPKGEPKQRTTNDQ